MDPHSLFVLLTVTLLCSPITVIGDDVVEIRGRPELKYFSVPTSEEPVVTWMDVQKGIYPNTSQISSSLRVGEPVTIFIYLQDPSNLYDVMVTDCWAYDSQNFNNAKNRLHLTHDHSKKKRKLIESWQKIDVHSPKLKSFLYTDLASFKFPETEHIYMKCDIQLCFKSCEKLKT